MKMPFLPHLASIFGSQRTPQQRFERSFEKLSSLVGQAQIGTLRAGTRVWKHYCKTLKQGAESSANNLVNTVNQFDAYFTPDPKVDARELEEAIALLLESDLKNELTYAPCSKLIRRLASNPRQWHFRQTLCVSIAKKGTGDQLLAVVSERVKDPDTSRTHLEQILKPYLERTDFEPSETWRRLLSNISRTQLPSLHRVHALLGEWDEAAELAQAGGDLRSAIGYLNEVETLQACQRSLEMAEQLGVESVLRNQQLRCARQLFAQGQYSKSLELFELAKANNEISDCHKALNHLDKAIESRTDFSSEWTSDIWARIAKLTQHFFESKDVVSALRLLAAVARSWKTLSSEHGMQAHVQRADRLLQDAVRTMRASMEMEVRASQAPRGAEVFKRWSLMEEAAGNYLEAGVQAEMAQDFFAASLLFEKAGAFGHALAALSHGDMAESVMLKKAELLQQAGDEFMAALVYEKLGDHAKAIHLLAQAGEYNRAADLCRSTETELQLALSDTWRDLMIKAGRTREYAERCVKIAGRTGMGLEHLSHIRRNMKHLLSAGTLDQDGVHRVSAFLEEGVALQNDHLKASIESIYRQEVQSLCNEWLPTMGLDLGTSNTVVALFNRKSGKPEIAPWRGSDLIPSVFAVDQNGVEMVGVSSSELLGIPTQLVVSRFKRAMGTDARFKVGENLLRPEEISAKVVDCALKVAHAFLKNVLEERIRRALNQRGFAHVENEWVSAYLEEKPPALLIKQAVITVPAYFNEAQKQATRAAAALCGLNVQRLMHEPTAACLAQRSNFEAGQSLLVVDLGAGTLDLSLIHAQSGLFEVQEIEGDNQFGGSDLDDLLYTHFLSILEKRFPGAIKPQSMQAQRLRQACEELKVELSSHDSWTIRLPHFVGMATAEIHLKRKEFESLAESWLNKLASACRRIKGRPQKILLVGGGAMMPAVRRKISEAFGMQPISGSDPMTAVARGAAIQAAILAGEIQELLVLDATPFGLGIRCHSEKEGDHNDILIPKHTTIPTRITKTYSTFEDNQSGVKIEVFQGEKKRPEDNYKVGQFSLEGIPPAKAGIPKIEVTFEIDANCLLRVTAVDTATKKENKISIVDSHLLTPAQFSQLQSRQNQSRTHQEHLQKLRKTNQEIQDRIRSNVPTQLDAILRRFEDSLRHYESNMQSYLPAGSDNDVLLEIYRSRSDLATALKLASDKWSVIRQSAALWLETSGQRDPHSSKPRETTVRLQEGERQLQRIDDSIKSMVMITEKYRSWLYVLENLPLNPETATESLIKHHIARARYEDAWNQFSRLKRPLAPHETELGLRILSRLRRKSEYAELLAQTLGSKSTKPDFSRLHETVRSYQNSVVLIFHPQGAGSGFAIAPDKIATNRHVILDAHSQKPIPHESIRVYGKNGQYHVRSLQIPEKGGDDIAILHLEKGADLMTLRLGYSEMVEVGERVMTIGFPAPQSSDFDENVYCNLGLVNRIRSKPCCSERVLEVSVELRGGISGAPLMNELGEVIGILTFGESTLVSHTHGHSSLERAFYAIPVSVLRRLIANSER